MQIIEEVDYFKLRSKMCLLVFVCVHSSVLIENKFLSEVVLKSHLNVSQGEKRVFQEIVLEM